MLSIDINDAAQATLGIADADAEVHAYKFRLAPKGLSLFAIEVIRSDSDASYLVRELTPGRWTCSCPAETYRKRGAPHCKHCEAVRLLRSWLRDFLAPIAPNKELPDGKRIA